MHPVLVFEYMRSQNSVMHYEGSMLLSPKLQIVNQQCECNEAEKLRQKMYHFISVCFEIKVLGRSPFTWIDFCGTIKFLE